MIAVEDLAVARGGVPVLEGVSLSLSEGEFVGLVGPNGAGKTTLLRTINGVLEPDSGRVTVAGRSVTDSPAREVSRLVATVSQDPSLAFDFSVADVVAMGRTPYASRFGRTDHEADRRAVERAMDRTDTARFADRSVRDLSGGERQRVLLARALAQETPALLLDEPTASLDVNHQVRTLGLVADRVAEGKTALAAIHDLGLAARFCDRLALLADGGIVAAGPPAEVLDAAALSTAFDTDAAVATDPVTGTPSVAALDTRAPRDLQVHLLGAGRLGSRVLATLADAGFAVTVGPVPDGDLTAETARARAVEHVPAPTFEEPGAGVRDAVAEHCSRADAAVLADPPLSLSALGGTAEALPSVVVTEATPGVDAVGGPNAPTTVAPDGVVAAVLAAAEGESVPADD